MRQLYTALLFPLALQAFAQAGTLDPTLDNDGMATTDVGLATFDEGNGLALQPDGGIVVVGTSGYSGEQDFGLVRYLMDGSPDGSFGTDGRVRASITPGDDVAASVAVQDDGKLVVGGYAPGMSGFCFALFRCNADGTPDDGFGTNGVVTTDLPGGETMQGRAVAVLDDGRILLAGGGGAGFAVMCYSADGTVDGSFGTDGLATVSFAPNGAQANAIAVLDDGRIVLAGYAAGEDVSIALARLNSDGTLDTDFGSGGTTTAQVQGDALARSMTIDATGRIVVTGSSLLKPVVARFTPDGLPDLTFNGNGIRTLTLEGTDNAMGYAVAVEESGKILVAGAGNFTSSDLLLARLNDDGTFDFTFDGDGFVTTDIDGARDVARGMALQPDGRIVLAGLTDGGAQDYDFALARYLTDGPTGVAVLGAAATTATVWPSPLTAASTIRYTLERSDDITIALYDMEGRRVQDILPSATRVAGRHEEPLLTDASLPAGNYLVVLRGRSFTASVRVAR